MTFHRPEGPNFKPPKPERGTAAAKRHMARVAKLPCVICGSHPVHVHHVICGRYGQRRPSDFDTIPLCVACHQIGPTAIHNGKETWERRNGPDWGYLPLVRAWLDENDEIDF